MNLIKYNKLYQLHGKSFSLNLFHQMTMGSKRYQDFNTYLRDLFGCRVQKISIDAGFTCPNRDGSISTGGCIYCDQKGSGSGAYQRGTSITDQIQQGKEILSRKYKARKFIAYFQSFSNTYAPVNELKTLYDEALSIEDIVGLSIGTRPDCVDEEALSLLEGYADKSHIWIEYGIQSAHNRTLEFIHRGHDWKAFSMAVKTSQGRGIHICTHVIFGLPGESKGHVLDTAKRIAGLGIDGIKIHSLYVVQGTPMEDLYRRGAYHCLDQDEYVEWVCEFLEILPPSMIVQRLTSDPDPDQLVAPLWTLNKLETLKKIDRALVKRDSWQGRLFGRNR